MAQNVSHKGDVRFALIVSGVNADKRFMVLHDIMIGYDHGTKTYKFYSDGREVEVKGDMAYYQVCLLLANAVEKKGERHESR